MATLLYWTDFQKRKNSTKTPSNGTQIDVKLKENTSIENPVFICSNLANANYCKYGDNYYFVDDIVYVTNIICELHCSMDILATNKSAILGSSQFVKYYTHNNTEITDARLSTKTTKTILASSGTFDTLGSGATSNNAVVVNVVGKDTCGSYATTQDIARTLLTNFDTWYDDELVMPKPDDNPFTEIPYAIWYFCKQTWFAIRQLLATGKADDSIRNAIMLPLPKSAIGGYDEEIYLGNYKTDKIATRIVDRVFSDGCDVTIPWQATDWRRNAPYHELFLYIPYIGLIALSPSDLIGESTIHVSVNLDVTTGDAIFSVYATNNNHMIGQYHTNLASAYAIGSSNITPMQGATAIVSGATALVSGGSNLILGASALGLANALNAQPTTIGSNAGGAVLGLGATVKCYSIYHDTTVNPSNVSAIMGEPFNGVMQIPSSGYVQTVNASVNGIAYGKEKDAINNMLDNGIYIE